MEQLTMKMSGMSCGNWVIGGMSALQELGGVQVGYVGVGE